VYKSVSAPTAAATKSRTQTSPRWRTALCRFARSRCVRASTSDGTSLPGTNDFDFHRPHWHGNTVLTNQMRTDVSISPMQMVSADVVPDNVGTPINSRVSGNARILLWRSSEYHAPNRFNSI
jgi:hypothetical protein